jgi:hypothetical protein
MTTFELPAYIDPAVLRPGQTVQCILDGTETILTVVRVEPALICSKPDGTGVMVLAHTVVPVETEPPDTHIGKRARYTGRERAMRITGTVYAVDDRYVWIRDAEGRERGCRPADVKIETES